MNTRFIEVRASFFRPANRVPAAAQGAAPQAAARHLHRERDFGVGYGNSSGYGRDRHYTSNGFAPLFRCA
ncbi:hypothetical protein ACFPOA_12130 [Lysobacter niabensis]|uniref:hypothetical protein n=1 Tax=Agrilutibacter niabensis TaxID=380628 RepID=UPI0036140C25